MNGIRTVFMMSLELNTAVYKILADLFCFPFQVFEFCMKKPKEDTLKLVEKLGIKLTVDDKEMHEKQLLKVRSTSPLFQLKAETLHPRFSLMIHA